MCIGGSPKIKDPEPPIDRNTEAATKGFAASRKRRANTLQENDTDIVGSLIARKNTGVQTQLKTLFGT